MNDASTLPAFLVTAQWVAAFLFVPLVCFFEGARKTVTCRWSALLSGLAVQYLLVASLSGSGFSLQAVLLIASIAAYAWVRLLIGWMSGRRTTA